MQTRKRHAGQAMVELAVGLVAIIVLLGALIQIGRLTQARSLAMADARAEAGALGMSPTTPAWPLDNEYIYNWQAGRDGRAYTRDDVTIPATSAVDAVQAAVEASGMADVPAPPANPFGGMAAGVNPAEDFALVFGTESESVDVLAAIRRLVYNQDTITVSGSAWMVWTEGIY